MSDLPFEYNIALEAGEEQVLIDWNTEKGWLAKYADLFERLDRITYIPAHEGSPLPVITVDLTGERRWVLFSRVYGLDLMGGNQRVRLYCIGWQTTTAHGDNLKALTWIYPNGAIEVAENPTYWKDFAAQAPFEET